MRFNIGDRVRQTASSAQTDANLVAHWSKGWQRRVGKTDGTFFVTGYHPNNNKYILYSSKPNGDGPSGGWPVDQFELVESASATANTPTTNPFLKTVTETKIVDARHYLDDDSYLEIEFQQNYAYLTVSPTKLDKRGIAELARILSEISEHMV